MKFALPLVACVISLTPVQARIGESEDEIAKRYGKPRETEAGYVSRHKRATYRFANYEIYVEFVDGKSALEFFKTLNHQPISPAETEIILTANAPTEQWTLVTGNETVYYRDWESRNLKAMRDDNKGILVVEAKWANEWIEGAKAEADKKTLQGF